MQVQARPFQTIRPTDAPAAAAASRSGRPPLSAADGQELWERQARSHRDAFPTSTSLCSFLSPTVPPVTPLPPSFAQHRSSSSNDRRRREPRRRRRRHRTTMPFGAKRSFTESLSPPSQSSSSDDEPVDPPLKRRFLSSPQAASPNEPTADGPPIFTPYYTPQSSGVGLKRAADDLEVDDDDDSGSSTEGERDGSSPTTTTYVPNDAGHHGATAHHHRPPPVKRLRRGLASHLKRMGLDPADLGPSVEEQPSHAYTAAPWASAFPQQQPSQPPDVEPSSVVEPGEVGPAVWLGHSRSGIGDEVRFEELDDSDGSDLEAEKTKAWRLEVWKGAHGADDGRSLCSIVVASAALRISFG